MLDRFFDNDGSTPQQTIVFNSIRRSGRDPSFANLIAYRQRLLSRPSFARAVDEARPFRSCFPPGAPDRD